MGILVALRNAQYPFIRKRKRKKNKQKHLEKAGTVRIIEYSELEETHKAYGIIECPKLKETYKDHGIIECERDP